ncbi:hypothetical protein BHE74_00054079 [Ensete ventricosum]|nr:hypothetical protein BHE74_00054079 [Ensete ventricosum]
MYRAIWVLPLGLAKVKSMHRVDAFGNSPGVCQKLAEGIGSLPRWRKGVRQKKTETRRKIVGEDRRTCHKIAGGCRSMREYSTTYCLLRSLVEHSCINSKSSTFGYLDKKLVDTNLMKFLGLCPSALSWYLEFASAFSTSSAPFTINAFPP